MKTRNILASLLILSAMMTACEQDFETRPEGSTVTSEIKGQVVAADPSKAEAGVNALYAQFNEYMGVTGSRHNDFGYPALMLIYDSDGYDFVSTVSGYNWFSGGLEYDHRIYTSYETSIVWETLYKIINVANSLIGSIDPKTDDPTLQFYLGQGLAARAFCYWNLAQLYAFNYADHKSAACVPVVTDVNMAQVAEEGKARDSVEAVYKQIMDDLNAAITMLDNADEAGLTRADKRYINNTVAYGLRARVNLTMENWSAAASDAQEALARAAAEGLRPYTMAEVSTPTMYDASDPAYMWGDIIAETDRVVTSGIVNWPSHMGSFNYGYCWYMGGHQINYSLFKSIPDTDVRKGWWTDENYYSDHLSPLQNYVINTYVEYPPLTQVKFAPDKGEMLQDQSANDIPLMRVEEMYLIAAEGLAMGGSPAEGAALLEQFVQAYRDPAYSCPETSAKGVQEAVYWQRRVELWGEGLSWFDIMRLKKNVDRRGGGYDDALVFNIPYGDNIMLWRLPESEIQANPMISEGDNNPSGETPKPVADIDY